MTATAKVTWNNPMPIAALVQYEAEFLDRASLVACVNVCTFWRQDMLRCLDFYLEKELILYGKLPSKFIRALHERNISFLALPILYTLRSYSDFPKINKNILPSPLMRLQFSDGCCTHDRVGVIASVRFKTMPSESCVIFSHEIPIFPEWETSNPPLNHLFSQFTMHHFGKIGLKSLYDDADYWDHNAVWPFSEIVAGTHPVLEINGKIDQIVNASLPRKDLLCDALNCSVLLYRQCAKKREERERKAREPSLVDKAVSVLLRFFNVG